MNPTINLQEQHISQFVRTFFPPLFKGHALEIGASDGLYLSNTINLEKEGWKVLCIEPNPEYYKDLVKNRPITLNYACSDHNDDNGEIVLYERHPIDGSKPEPVMALDGLSEEFWKQFCPEATCAGTVPVKIRTLDSCLEEVGFPKLDYLSLDVDGRELDILNGLDVDRWGLKVAVVESCFEDPEMEEYFTSRGFSFRERVHVNDIWVRDAL